MNLVNFHGRVVYEYYEFMTQHGLGQASRPEMFYFKYFEYFDNAQCFSSPEDFFKNQNFKLN